MMEDYSLGQCFSSAFQSAYGNQYPLGQCFKNALLWADDNKQFALTVVHGCPIYSCGRMFAHAWVEWGDTCYEPAGSKLTPKSEFYSKFQIDPKLCRYYSPAKAMEMGARTGHAGPWHEMPAGCIYSTADEPHGVQA